MHFGPGHQGGQIRVVALNGSWITKLECLFVTKSNSQRLKKSKKLSFRNSPFTRQNDTF